MLRNKLIKMEKTINIFLEYGLVGAMLVVSGFVIVKLYNRTNELQKDLIQARDNELQRKEKDSEQYISVIEKALNGLTSVEKALFESNTKIPVHISEAIATAHAPLISDLRRVLEQKQNG